MLQPSSWRAEALLVLVTTATGLAQKVKGPAVQQEAMKKLGSLVGQWKGGSWSEFIPVSDPCRRESRPLKGSWADCCWSPSTCTLPRSMHLA